MNFFASNIFCKSNLPEHVLSVGFPWNCNMESENKWAKSLQLDKSQTSTSRAKLTEAFMKIRMCFFYDINHFLPYENWVEFCLNTIDWKIQILAFQLSPLPNPGLVKASVQKFSLLASTSFQLISFFLQLVGKFLLWYCIKSADLAWYFMKSET